LVSGTKIQTKTAMAKQKMANIRNVRHPMLLMAEGVTLVMTKLKSHWVAAGIMVRDCSTVDHATD
jgi:hypothetical protein